MTEPLVEVLLSTYNGESHIAEQVASILSQTHGNLRLTVRDDGSTDGTLAVLRRFPGDRVRIVEGENLGLPAAYFRLVDDSSDDADFFALADQDDVWARDKVARGATALSQIEGPALYCARVLVTDEQLHPLYAHALPRRGPSFANALVQNIALGCTTLLNRPARDLLRHRWPTECVMHDAWMYLVIAGCGTVFFDEQVAVHYRQHLANSVGIGRSAWSRFAGRVRRQLAEGPGKHGAQDRELMRTHGTDLRPENLAMLADFLAAQSSFGGRLRYALTGAARRQTPGGDLILRGLQIAGRV